MQSVFVGRQPVLDRAARTVGYELLFRSSELNRFDPGVNGDTATASVLSNSIMEMGLDRIVGSRVAFVNLTARFLAAPDILQCLPPHRVVLEVLEDVHPTADVISGIRRLKRAGYRIALDDYRAEEHTAPLYQYADIIKYDITQHDADTLPAEIEKAKREQRKLLAERVETAAEFQHLSDIGFDYFQGYFFARPAIVHGSRIPPRKLALLELVGLINQDDISLDDLAEATTREISLSLRALRFVNSPMTGLCNSVTSIKQALVLLGRETIRNWVTLLVMAGMDDKPMELVSMALVRARFCQLAAIEEGREDDGDFFTVGLLSLLDVIMGADMRTVLDDMRAPAHLRHALLEQRGLASQLLEAARVLEVSLAPSSIACSPPIKPYMAARFQEAMLWAETTRRHLN